MATAARAGQQEPVVALEKTMALFIVIAFPGLEDGVEVGGDGQRQRHQLSRRPVHDLLQADKAAALVVADLGLLAVEPVHHAVEQGADNAQHSKPEDHAEPAAQRLLKDGVDRGGPAGTVVRGNRVPE